MARIPVVVSWNEASHVESLRKCAAELRDVGFDVTLLRDDAPPEFPDEGIALIQRRGSIDLPDRIPAGCRVVRIASNDTAGVFESIRRQISRIALVVKASAVYRPPSLNNLTDGLHLNLLGEPWKKLTRLPAGRLANIVTGPCSHACMSKMSWSDAEIPNIDGPFEYDVSFVGTASHERIIPHRQKAVEAIRSLSGLRVRAELLPTRLPMREYLRILRSSRIAVSPWGYGEFGVRDYEAMALGAVVVKPATGFIRDWCDSYRDWETYFPCDLNFQTLDRTVRMILEQWDSLQPTRISNRKRIEASRAVSAQVAGWVKLFQTALG